MSYCKNLLHPNAKQRPTTLLGLLVTSLLWAAPTSAKFEDYLTKRWFTIELIVFERANINDENTLESLAHPMPVDETLGPDDETLVEDPIETLAPEQGSNNLQRAAQALNEPLNTELEIDPEAEMALIPQEITEQRQRLETVSTEEDPEQEQLRLALLEALDAYELELAERNLVFQPDANPRLEDELERLARGRNNNVLWRGHWLQAVPNRAQPQPLMVAVNELENGELQLQGSLEVTVNRYLHLKAQLWYHDPSFGADLLSEELAGYQVSTPDMTQTTGLAPGVRKQLLEANAPEQQALETLGPEPLYMLLEETRRMRSGFLHYLDHPKLGLLVRIDKVPPPPELLAQYQAFESSQK